LNSVVFLIWINRSKYPIFDGCKRGRTSPPLILNNLLKSIPNLSDSPFGKTYFLGDLLALHPVGFTDKDFVFGIVNAADLE